MKIVLICCYFGKFPDYFELWLNSAKNNELIDFILITDNNIKNGIPSNVKIINQTFEELKNEIQEKFEFKIKLDKPYKLCDLKPAYGFLFEKYIKAYDFWGHYDIDVIYGNLMKYLKKEVLDKYDKIYRHGHFSLYKNKNEINLNFKELKDKNSDVELYKKVFSSDKSYFFDETDGIIQLYNTNNDNKYKMYLNDNNLADISIKWNNLIPNCCNKNGKYIFQFKNVEGQSVLYGYYKKNKKIEQQEFMYVHLQKRKIKNNTTNLNEFYITPKEFVNIENEMTLKLFKKLTYKFNCYRIQFIKFKFNNFKKKIKNKILLRKG